eukprot:gnl/TRDRNA2_/TRDRNA2_179609_c0_seq1.p2 gnl/TRDRNA2_/TRDRNA2_179609_c0~~gnl/TRDRNA2_/TRDRNA2_179609_c0_seq1.p2  ORF type:complete len:137 (-),score=34.29 gnl/TRDRNA2_/TRDRNA2_179609_c0_seq1:91-501(-)
MAARILVLALALVLAASSTPKLEKLRGGAPKSLSATGSKTCANLQAKSGVKFMPTMKEACASCKAMAKKFPSPEGCDCQVGDCSGEMKKVSDGDCGGGDDKYYCAVCAPIKFETKDDPVKTTDWAKEGKWDDVGLC